MLCGLGRRPKEESTSRYSAHPEGLIQQHREKKLQESEEDSREGVWSMQHDQHTHAQTPHRRLHRNNTTRWKTSRTSLLLPRTTHSTHTQRHIRTEHSVIRTVLMQKCVCMSFRRKPWNSSGSSVHEYPDAADPSTHSCLSLIASLVHPLPGHENNLCLLSTMHSLATQYTHFLFSLPAESTQYTTATLHLWAMLVFTDT